MRRQFISTVTRFMTENEKTVLLLGDIGVHGFRDAFKAFPGRVFNIGILEQSMVSVAAGWALRGYLPIVHTIAPFMVERAYEQLKVDFGYQNLPGIFVSVGGSYDYASLGCTHHCPADVALISNIPGFQVFVPGTPRELDQMFNLEFSRPTYIRLSEHNNSTSHPPGVSNLQIAPLGLRTVFIAVGPTLDLVTAALEGSSADVYYTNIVNSDVANAIVGNYRPPQTFIVVENFYSSQIANDIARYYFPDPVAVTSFSVPRQFITSYGKKSDIDKYLDFSVSGLRQVYKKCKRI